MRCFLTLCAVALFVLPAQAQQPRARAATPPPAVHPAPAVQPAPPVPEPPPAAYEPDLLRLAEVMGALAYLSPLCTPAPRDADWLARMQLLLDAEGTSPGRKERLAGAYNRGYLGYQPTHRACTERSRAALDDLLSQGGRLARELSSKYGA
jgi:uncharacterized protein (TIGR02301 family)